MSPFPHLFIQSFISVRIHIYFIHLYFILWAYCCFVAEIIPALATGSSFRLAPMSLWHAPILLYFWVLVHFLVLQDTPSLSFPCPNLKPRHFSKEILIKYLKTQIQNITLNWILLCFPRLTNLTGVCERQLPQSSGPCSDMIPVVYLGIGSFEFLMFLVSY